MAQEVRRPLLEAGIFGGGGLLPDYPASDRAEPRALVAALADLSRRDPAERRARPARPALPRGGPGADAERQRLARQPFRRRGTGGDAGPRVPRRDRSVPALDRVARRRAAHAADAGGPVARRLRDRLSTRIRHRGFTFAPEIALERTGVLNAEGRARIGIGPVFASGGLMDYWYRVKPDRGAGRTARPMTPRAAISACGCNSPIDAADRADLPDGRRQAGEFLRAQRTRPARCSGRSSTRRSSAASR